MKAEKRSSWYLWSCDLAGCDLIATTHPKVLGDETPYGWVTIAPPMYWRGPLLSFCGIPHRDQFMGDHLRAQLQLEPGDTKVVS